MTETAAHKSLSTDPIKVSPPLGAALAILGINRSLPVLHGAQGCTAFAMVLLVRHFREPIPVQTTALGELDTTLGAGDRLADAVRTIQTRYNPEVIGVCPTALTDTAGEDLDGNLQRIAKDLGQGADAPLLVHTPAPDFVGGLQEGWAAAVTGLVDAAAAPAETRRGHINVLAGSHLTVADLDNLKALIDAFGLTATIIPDLADSLDGHMPSDWSPVSSGGTTRDSLGDMGAAEATLALGSHMRSAAELLEARTQVPATVIDGWTGLDGADQVTAWLARIAGNKVPAAIERARSRLQDALADSHLEATGARVAIAAEPDILRAVATLCRDLGCQIPVAVTTTRGSGQSTRTCDGRPPSLADIPADRLLLGDLEDLREAAAAVGGVDLVIGPSPAKRTAAELDAPLLRAGFPQTDRAGNQYQALGGYGGTRELAFRIANALHDHFTDDLLGAPAGPARPDPANAPPDTAPAPISDLSGRYQ